MERHYAAGKFMPPDNFRRRFTDACKVLISPSGAANFYNARAHWESGRWVSKNRTEDVTVIVLLVKRTR